MFSNEDDLTAAELEALGSLSRETRPSDLLEERVVRALKSEGHFSTNIATQSRRRGTGLPLSLRIAAGIALFAGGVATGHYLTASGDARRAAVQSVALPAATTTPGSTGTVKSAKASETVVAEREMWL